MSAAKLTPELLREAADQLRQWEDSREAVLLGEAERAAELAAHLCDVADGLDKEAQVEPVDAAPLVSLPVGGFFIEVQPSLNIVLRQPYVMSPDVVITLTKIDGLHRALNEAVAVRDIQESR